MEGRELARKLMEAIPAVMGVVRAELRHQAKPLLSVPQFRVLIMLNRGVSCNRDLAEQMGTSVPAMSKVVDQLVRSGLVTRETCCQDRRQMELRLTAAGRNKFSEIDSQIRGALAGRIEKLSKKDRDALEGGLVLLHGLFTQGNL